MITHLTYRIAGSVIFICLLYTLIALQQVSYTDPRSGFQGHNLANRCVPNSRSAPKAQGKIKRCVSASPKPRPTSTPSVNTSPGSAGRSPSPIPPTNPVHTSSHENPIDVATCATTLSSLIPDIEIGWSNQFDHLMITSNNPDPNYEFFEQPVQIWHCGQPTPGQLNYTWSSPEGNYEIDPQNLIGGYQEIPDYSAPGKYELSITYGTSTFSKAFVVREYDGARIHLYDVAGENITDLSTDSSLNKGAAGVSPGDLLTVSYEGFPPNDNVTVGLYGGPNDSSSLDLFDQWQITVDSDGVFTEYLLLPNDAEPGLYRLVACASSGCQYFDKDFPAVRTTFELVTTPATPQPSSPSTSGLFPIATPVYAMEDIARINASADWQELWLRAGAGENRRAFDWIPPDSLVEIQGQPRTIADQSWYKVQFDKREGWINAAALLPIEQIPSIAYWLFAWADSCDDSEQTGLALLLPGEGPCDVGVETWDMDMLSASLLEQKLLKPGERLKTSPKGGMTIYNRGDRPIGELTINDDAMDTLARTDSKNDQQVGPLCQLRTDYEWECRDAVPN